LEHQNRNGKGEGDPSVTRPDFTMPSFQFPPNLDSTIAKTKIEAAEPFIKNGLAVEVVAISIVLYLLPSI
jgi:hypothetical protein